MCILCFLWNQEYPVFNCETKDILCLYLLDGISVAGGWRHICGIYFVRRKRFVSL